MYRYIAHIVVAIVLFVALLILGVGKLTKRKSLNQMAHIFILVAGVITALNEEMNSPFTNADSSHIWSLRNYQLELVSMLMYLLSILSLLSYAANKYYWKSLFGLNLFTLITGIFVFIWLLVSVYSVIY